MLEWEATVLDETKIPELIKNTEDKARQKIKGMIQIRVLFFSIVPPA